MIKNTIFNNRINIEIKTTKTALIKNKLKYFSISKVNRYSRAKPRGITLKMIQSRTSLDSFC